MPPAWSPEQFGDRYDLLGGRSHAEALLHPELAQQAVCLVFGDFPVPHEYAFGAVDQLALAELRPGLRQLVLHSLERFEARNGRFYDRRDALGRETVHYIGAHACSHRIADRFTGGVLSEHHD